jgi:hypothetical protein
LICEVSRIFSFLLRLSPRFQGFAVVFDRSPPSLLDFPSAAAILPPSTACHDDLITKPCPIGPRRDGNFLIELVSRAVA